MQGWTTFAPTFPSVAMTVLIWFASFGGGLWRAHSTMAFWKPTVLTLSLFSATQWAVVWYVVFEFADDVRNAGLPWWQGMVVAASVTLIAVWGGQWLKNCVPAFVNLRARIAAKDDKVFAGDRYPDKPLDFTADGAP